MKTIKKIVIILSLFIIATGCSSIGKSNETVSNVTVTEITFNDIDQVMIFAENNEIKHMIFVKDFYSKLKSREAIDEEIKKCISSLEKFRGKKALIKYYKNEQGDNIFLEIN
jgi:hypothetical protein